MSELIGKLRIALGLDSAAFETGAKRAAAQVDTFGSKMEKAGFKAGQFGKALAGGVAAFAGSAVVQEIRQAAMEGLELASSLGEQAQQLGVTTNALQFYRYAATQVGIDQAEMDKGLGKLTIKLGQLATGTDKQRAELEKYGFTQAEIAKLTTATAEQALPILAERMKALKSPTEQAALMAEFFGAKMGGKFTTLLADGAKGIEALTRAYKDLGIEISAEQIAKADAAMDKLAQTTLVLKANQAQLAADNADTVIKFDEMWTKIKMLGMKFVVWNTVEYWGALSSVYAKYQEANAALGTSIREFFIGAGKWAMGFADSVLNATTHAEQWVGQMVTKIGQWMGAKLDAIWEGAKKKIDDVKGWFFGLYDAVVGHSYIPDMVDGIAAQMKRLDAVMVDPALKATKSTADAFKALAAEVQPLLDRLFPEAAARRQFDKDWELLDQAQRAGMIDRGTLSQGRERLGDEFFRSLPANDNPPQIDAWAGFDGLTVDMDKLQESVDRVGVSIEGVIPDLSTVGGCFGDVGAAIGEMKTDIARSLTDVILHGKSFGEAMIEVFDRFASRILDNLFENLLGDVFDGIFGGMGIPGFAGGTSFAPGGLALVGERGPELVDLPRGSKVYPNGTGPAGGGNVYHISGNLLTPEFWAEIQRMDAQSAQAGSQIAQSDLAWRQSRRIGG